MASQPTPISVKFPVIKDLIFLGRNEDQCGLHHTFLPPSSPTLWPTRVGECGDQWMRGYLDTGSYGEGAKGSKLNILGDVLMIK